MCMIRIKKLLTALYNSTTETPCEDKMHFKRKFINQCKFMKQEINHISLRVINHDKPL